MKLCIECKHHQRKAFPVDPQGRVAMVDACTHPEVCDPVTGELIPCQIARQQAVFCQFSARYWEQKEKTPEPDTPAVIEIARG